MSTAHPPASGGDTAASQQATNQHAAATSGTELEQLRSEIDSLDAQLIELIRRRTQVSRRIGALRMASGGPRLVHNREMSVIARFRELGPEGRELALLLLRLGRGRLGH